MIIHARAKRKETSGTKETVEGGYTVRKALAVIAAKFMCFQPNQTKPNPYMTLLFELETKLRDRVRETERKKVLQ